MAELSTGIASAVAQDTPAAMTPAGASLGTGENWTHFLHAWWPLGLGLLALLASTGGRFALGYWQQPEFEHGPLMLAAALWLLWHERSHLLSAERPASITSAWIAIVFGLVVYLLGVRLKMGYVEAGALIPIFAGALLLVGGWPLLRKNYFFLIFLGLAVPLPSPLINAATSGLKEWVSVVAESVLHLGGYPIARDGVTLRIGAYNLLLADACSGMNSLISLSAVGLMYIHLTVRRSLVHTWALVAAILPIAVITNIIRVMILVLITYYLGDAAGQGFLHEFSGFVMFLIALGTFALLDMALGKVLKSHADGAPSGEHLGAH